ncbi:hypothetical protein DFH11DRAFT_206365 [Phellopilus nigrolimitatus]|nr:hypothetical protein DFH11DRAFT_206365 [Phellopilus nigrolimitatus]
MNSPQEPVSPSPSTPSSGSPPPDDIPTEHLTPINPISPLSSQQLASPSQTKRRLASGPSAHSRDLKTRKRDDGGSKRNFGQTGEMGGREGREGGRKDELVDVDLMERLKQEFGDPFDESDLKAFNQ